MFVARPDKAGGNDCGQLKSIQCALKDVSRQLSHMMNGEGWKLEWKECGQVPVSIQY
jgi:hypothetical protein